MPNAGKKNPRYPANADAPKFTPEVWTRADGNPISANGIAYAYAGSNPDGSNVVSGEPALQLGNTAGYLQLYPDMINENNLPHLLQAEGLIWAGKKPLKSDSNQFEVPPSKSGYYLVGIYTPSQLSGYLQVGKPIDFAFPIIRQDSDGGWSEKMGADFVRRVWEPDSSGGYRPLNNHHIKNYQFAGYAYVPKHGIEGGIQQKLIPEILYAAAKGNDICNRLSSVTEFYATHETQPWGVQQLHAISETLKKYNIPEAQEVFETCVLPRLKSVRPDFATAKSLSTH